MINNSEIGKTYHNWTILSYIPMQERNNKDKRYLAKCKCGTTKEIRLQDIKSGHTTSCGCLKKKLLTERSCKDITNQKFGRLIALQPTGKSKNNSRMWKCKCDCGNHIEVRCNSLTSGNTRSCGCLLDETNKRNGELKIIDLTGKTFGLLTVIKKDKKDPQYGQYWLCQCGCGNETIVLSTNLTRLTTLSCGCKRRSYGETQIEKLLIENNVNFQSEFTFPELKSDKNKALRFDFAIFNQEGNLCCLIEFQGPQHFQPNHEWHTNNLVEYDQRKKKYCIDNNIKLIEILYERSKIITLQDLQLEELVTNERI